MDWHEIRFNIIKLWRKQCPNCENLMTTNVYYYLPFEEKRKLFNKLFDRHLFRCYFCGVWFRTL